MKKLSAIIVDDEARAIDGLRELLRLYCPEVEVVAIANSIPASVQEFVAHKPDIAFLDIELKDGSGFDVAEIAATAGSSIVFVTGHAGYAPQAFTVDAVHYLLKPVSFKDLRVAVTRAALRREKQVALNSDYKLRVATSAGVQYHDVKDIVSIEGDGRYSTLHFTNGKPQLVSRNMAEFEEELSVQGFFRVHKSWLINCSHVVKLSNTDGGTVELSDGKTVLLSRRRKSDFLKRMEG